MTDRVPVAEVPMPDPAPDPLPDPGPDPVPDPAPDPIPSGGPLLAAGGQVGVSPAP